MIVSFEGIDGSAKHTQSKLLHKWMQEKFGEKSTELQAFPDYSTHTGQAILGLLKEKWWVEPTEDREVSLRALLLQTLMTINRHEKYDLLKQASDNDYHHLILDRYYGSGIVYGMADGLDFDYLLNIHRSLPRAQLWLMLDITPEESVRRRPERRDEYEKRDGLMSEVRANYYTLFKYGPDFLGGGWQIINGMQSEEAVHAEIVDVVTRYIKTYMYGMKL